MASLSVVDLDLDEVKRGLADGSMLLVDVREPHEFTAGHIPRSVSHPLSTFDPAALPTAEGQRIVFSCAAGVRSCPGDRARAGGRPRSPRALPRRLQGLGRGGRTGRVTDDGPTVVIGTIGTSAW